VPSGGKKKIADKFLFIVIYSQPLDKEKRRTHTHKRERERPQLSADIGFESKGEESVSWKGGGYKELFISGQSRETQNKRPDFSSANPKEKKEKNFIHTTASRRRRRRVDKREGGKGLTREIRGA
jgi:hypothetical protein